MKHALSAVLAIALLVSSVSAQPSSVIEKAHRSLVTVNAPLPGDQTIYCSGVVIGIIRVLTAEHCTSPDNVGVVVDGKPARVIKKDSWLVLLEIAPTQGPIMEIAERNPPLGADVTSIGIVDISGTRLTMKRAVAGWMDGGLKMFLDGPIVQGMSGGPVIDDKGKLVGINQATNAWTGMVSTVKEIREFLK